MVPQDGILLLNSMNLHYIDYVRNHGLCDRYVLHFDPGITLHLNTPELNLLDCFIRFQRPGTILAPDPNKSPFILHKLEEMEKRSSLSRSLDPEENMLQLHMNQLYLDLELGELLILVNDLFRSQYGGPSSLSYQSHSQLVSEICRYIDAHYEENLTVECLSRQFLLSKTQLYNIFKEVLNLSVSDYLSHVRITQAKSLLIHTDYSVEMISQKVGYNNISSFSRVFKAKAGTGPLQYRKKQSLCC